MSAPSTMALQRAAIQGTIWTAIQASLGLPLAVVANVVVSRALGPIDFGYLASLMVAFTIATSVANWGFSDATIQWGARAHGHGDEEALFDLVRRCSGYHVFVETPLLVVVVLVMLHGAPWPYQMAAALGTGLTMLLGTASVTQTLLSRTASNARIVMAANVALQASVAVAALASGSGLATWAIRVLVASIGPVLAFARVSGRMRSAILRPALPKGWPSGFVSFAAKSGLGSLAAMLVFGRSELLVLQFYNLTQSAGLYALGFGLAAQVTAPIDAVLAPLVPAAASLVATAPNLLGSAVLRGLRFMSVAAGATAALTIPPVAALITLIYGAGYAGAVGAFVSLALISCVQSFNHPITAFAYGLRKVGALLLINMAAFALDMLIAFTSVRSLHAWGAVAANAAGQLVSLGGAAYLVRRELCLTVGHLAGTMRSLVAGSVAAVLGWAAANVWAHSGVPALGRAGIGLLAGGAVFLALQRLGLPSLADGDARLMVDAVPRALRRPLALTMGFLRIAA